MGVHDEAIHFEAIADVQQPPHDPTLCQRGISGSGVRPLEFGRGIGGFLMLEHDQFARVIVVLGWGLPGAPDEHSYRL